MSTNVVLVSIIEGPSTDRLIDAFKYAFDNDGARFTVRFAVTFTGRLVGTPDAILDAQIIGIEYESGVPGMFNLTVNIDGYQTSTGCYNAIKRLGLFDLIPNS